MSWRNMSFGKKIGVGFGAVLFLLSVVGFLSFSGVGKIVANAKEVIDGNKLDGSLAQKEVDHLNWANKVNALLTDETVTTLKVQTDDHKCGFGKWLYGEDRKHAESLVPSLASLLKEIEAPHRKLHESAIEIDKVFKQPHAGLALTLSDRLTDHVSWVSRLGEALASEAGGLYAYQTQLKNAVDQVISVLRSNDHELEGGMKVHQDHALHTIKDLRYGSQAKDYFFIIDEKARMVMHPFKPELEGKDLRDSKDPSGKRLFSEMVRICKEKGAGFVTYQWPLPGTSQPVPKISYVKIYKPWGWIVGTGVYLDHTNQALLARADDFAKGKPFSAGLQLDPAKCAFGRFLADSKTKELAASFPELKAALDAIHEPHNHLHRTAEQIEDKVNHLDMHAAINIFNEDTQKALDGVKTHLHAAIEAEKKLQQGMDAANHIYAEQTFPSLEKVQGLLGDIRSNAKEHVMTDQTMLDAAQGTKLNVSVVGAAAMIIGILMAFFIARGIITVLQRISSQMDQGAEQVAAASSQVSSSSQQLAEGASEQAASIEETSSSLEEMSSMTKQNAANASQADTLMKKANQVVQQANQSMAALTGSMGSISKASEETSKIIKTIDEIAFQTNLLALNAAVEAARAGEAGAGFAVVADEVRNLAMRAADAAKNTSDLIEGTVKKVDDGSELVTKTNEAFGQVADSAKKVGELVGEIAAASDEQAQGIGQVNQAVIEMDKVVQQNAANAEESASASEEMNAQAEQMKGVMAELVTMVGGSKNGAGNGLKRIMPGLGKPSDSKTFMGSSAAVEHNKSIHHRPNKVTPEQIIPMEDADFKDF